MELDPNPPIRLDFDNNSDENNNTSSSSGQEYKTLLEDWFYEPNGANDPRSRKVGSIDPKRHDKWHLSTHTLSALQRLGAPLLSTHGNINKNPNYYYLWNSNDFKNAKGRIPTDPVPGWVGPYQRLTPKATIPSCPTSHPET